jgi:pentose-5-phosphate-3-epimerase
MSLSQKYEVEILPAILVKDRSHFLEQIEIVKPHVKGVHIDIMDDVFVPNKTLGPEELRPLPPGLEYSLHWMVESPEKWIAKLPGPHVHMIHVETVKSPSHFDEIEKAVKKVTRAAAPTSISNASTGYRLSGTAYDETKKSEETTRIRQRTEFL